MSREIQHPNTPYDIAGENSSLAVSSYEVTELSLLSQNSQNPYDIRRLLVSFTITEEIFSPIIVFTGVIRDDVNFFETAGIRGQERIRLTVRKMEPNESEKTVSLNLIVKSYPDYAKDSETINVQEYTIVAVSDYAYISSLQKISRAVFDNPITNIITLFKTYLGVNKIKYDEREDFACATPFEGIITLQTPLRAIEWLRTKCADGEGSPFFIYPRISEEDIIFIRSYRSILSEKTYPRDKLSYEYRDFATSSMGSIAGYEERKTRILTIRSNIKLDRLEQIKQGALGSKIEVTDLRKKTFFDKLLRRDIDGKIQSERQSRNNEILKGGDEWAKAVDFFTKTAKSSRDSGFNNPDLLDPIEAAKIEVQTQSDTQNSSQIIEQEGERIRSYLASLETMSHEIEIYGDLGMNPGNRINIKIPKAIDPTVDEQAEIEEDTSLSGMYTVAAAVHTFVNGEYTTRLKIIKDDI